MKGMKPARENEGLLEVLDLRLYDIINKLGSQMMAKGTECEYIPFYAHNGISNEDNIVTVILKKANEK